MDVREIMPRADPLGPLGGPHGRNEDRKDVKTGSVNERRNNLPSERGYIKHFKQYQVPWSMNDTTKGTGRLSGYVYW